MEVPADGDPEGAQEAVEGSMGQRGDEGVGECAGEGLLRERSVRVVEAYKAELLVDRLGYVQLERQQFKRTEEETLPELDEVDKAKIVARAQELCERLESLVADLAV